MGKSRQSVFGYVVVAVAAVLLAGCASTPNGASYSDAVAKAEPPQDKAELVFYRPPESQWGWRAPNIKVNGQQTCDLPPGGFFTYDVAPGNIDIQTSLWDMPGTSRALITAESGRRYALRIRPGHDKVVGGMIGGLVGMMIAEGTSDQKGPFDIDLLSEASAKYDLAQVKMIDKCTDDQQAAAPKD